MQMSQKYVRLNKTVIDKGILVKPEEVQNLIKDDKDYYTSTYYYNQDHFNMFQTTGSIKGIKDVKTSKLWFDFDSKDQTLLDSRKDTLDLITRLNGYNIDPNNLEIYFSGRKGFNVVLNLTREITPAQVKQLVNKLAKDLKTFDPSLYDESQLLRIPRTKHQDSGLFKIPLTLNQLQNHSIEQIKEAAAKNQPIGKFKYEPVDFDDSMFELEEVKKEIKTTSLEEFNVHDKPRNWKSSKWALMQGFFGPGERDQSMMILAATAKAMGYDKVTTYYMCKSALKKSWERFGEGNFKKEDLWVKIENVYGENWKGGQYSEKDDMFLQKKSDELGIKELTTTSTVDIKGALGIYKNYAKNINRLTLKTGIKELDEKQRITIGMSFGIIAAPGVGKTSIALQMLHSMSKDGELCVFFSYDMYAAHVIQKIVQKHWEGDDIEIVFKEYEAGNQEYINKVEELIVREYPNVEFCFDSGQTIQDIYTVIRDAELKRGMKCKFVVIDYNELVITDVADPTQSSNKTAQNIRELASKEQVCVLSLFQPSKMTGDPSSEITSYRAAKGGSGIEQSVSLMFGISRPGFNPRKPDDDKYVSINCVKNRMGSIFSLDLYWSGYKGEVRSLTSEEKWKLKKLRDEKLAEENGTFKGTSQPWDKP